MRCSLRFALAALSIAVAASSSCGGGPDAETADCGDYVYNAGRVGEDAVYTVTRDGQLQIWETDNLTKPLLTYKLPWFVEPWYVHALSKETAVWAHQFGMLEEFDVRIVDIANDKVLVRIPFETNACAGIAKSDDGRFIAWTAQGGVSHGTLDESVFRIRMASVDSGELLMDIEAKKLYDHQRFFYVDVDPSNKMIAFASSQGKAAIGVVDASSKTMLWLKAIPGIPYGVAVHPDGKSVFSGAAHGVGRFDSETGEQLSTWPVGAPARLLAVDVSPDGKYVAIDTEGAQGVAVFEVATGKVVKKIRASKYPIEKALFFSADSKGIWAAGSMDQTLKYFKIVE
ncbi:MAG: hypothetical protein ACYTAN_18445 [Planctomycetota bacterium]|jgi:DNA-binding beta-propeller fold protein YncE